MARFRKLIALGGVAAGAAAFLRRRRSPSSSSSSAPAPAPDPAPAPASGPTPDPGVGAAPVSVTTATPPPPESPGPSVSPVGGPASDVERDEQSDRTTPDPEVLSRRAGGPVDALVERETNAAAASAGRIGGRGSHDAHDPALDPVYEAGGGEQDGFEQSEAELIEAASHGDPAPDPMDAAFTPEVESDRATTRYGEPDEEDVTEVVRDPTENDPDDPGEGPGLAADR
jgi:hypothetical protein